MSFLKRIAAVAILLLSFSSIANAQSVTPLSVKDGNSVTQTLCQYKPDGTNLAGCTIQYVWNGSGWILQAVGPGTATGVLRTTVAQDSSTVAGSASLPAGANVIGGVTQSGAPWSVTQNPFLPGSSYATLSVTTTTARVALPVGNSIIVYNTGTNAAYVVLGGSATNATTTADVIQPGSWTAFNVGSNTYIAAITSSGTTNLIISGGSGLPTGTGGGSSGSGGSVTESGTWDVGSYSFWWSSCSSGCGTTLSVQNAAYAAGNSEGGLITLPIARSNGGTGTITNIYIRSNGGSTNSVWLYAFAKSPASTCTDKTAFSFNASDSHYLLPGFPRSVTLSNPGTWETGSYGEFLSINSQFENQDSAATKNVYFCIVTVGAVTPASTSDLYFVTTGIDD